MSAGRHQERQSQRRHQRRARNRIRVQQVEVTGNRMICIQLASKSRLYQTADACCNCYYKCLNLRFRSIFADFEI